MLKLADEVRRRRLECGVDLHVARHAHHLQELHERIQNGEIWRHHSHARLSNAGPCIGHLAPYDKPAKRLISNIPGAALPVQFPLVSGGGCFNDYYIHHVDHLSWMKNAWPVKAQAVGGRRTTEQHEQGKP